jgi:hypothetical protein
VFVQIEESYLGFFFSQLAASFSPEQIVMAEHIKVSRSEKIALSQTHNTEIEELIEKHKDAMSEQIEAPRAENPLLTQVHKAEMDELIQKHQGARRKFLKLSISFSQELHAMAIDIQEFEIEKASLVSIHGLKKMSCVPIALINPRRSRC